MKSAADYIRKAQKECFAIPHFNFSNTETLRAIIEVANQLKSPIFVATSEGERKFIGPRQAKHLVEAFKEEFQIPIFLNADHTKSWEKAKEAVDIGYDAVLIDASKLPFQENIELTKKVLNYAKDKKPDIIIEGEIGYLRGESKIQDFIEIKEEDLTKPEEASEFISQTKVDLLAPAVGNIHGIVIKSEEKLRINLIKEIKNSIGNTGLVLHGASGLSQQDIQEAIKNGINIVHINTELRVAFTGGLRHILNDNPKEVVPYKYLAKVVDSIKGIIEEKIKSFGSVGKI